MKNKEKYASKEKAKDINKKKKKWIAPIVVMLLPNYRSLSSLFCHIILSSSLMPSLLMCQGIHHSMLNSFNWYSSYVHVSFPYLVVFLEKTFESLTSFGGFLEDICIHSNFVIECHDFSSRVAKPLPTSPYRRRDLLVITLKLMRETQEDYYFVLFMFSSQLFFYIVGPNSLLGYQYFNLEARLFL